MQMVGAYLGRLFEVAGAYAPQRLDAGHAAIDLLAMALRDVVPSVPGCDGPAGVLLEMMRRYVREHLADPRLQVEELARRHYVSVSHVYSLFERIGTTPAAYLREQRLLAAQVMLSDPGTPGSRPRTSRLRRGSSTAGRSSGRSVGSTG